MLLKTKELFRKRKRRWDLTDTGSIEPPSTSFSKEAFNHAGFVSSTANFLNDIAKEKKNDLIIPDVPKSTDTIPFSDPNLANALVRN